MTDEKLRINSHGKFVLDPAVGKEELLAYFYSAGKEIDSYDIIDYQRHNYSHFTKKDFIEVYKEFKADYFFGSKPNTKYDYIIANPPYNCHEVSYIRDNKAQLKKLFEVGVYNMYSMYLSAIIDMAKDFNIKTVAEGVETKEQVDILKNMGCDMAQGYYYAKPLSRDDFVEYLTTKVLQ